MPLLGPALLTLALLAPIARLAAVLSVNWTPVVMPLAGGASERREFGVGHSGAYELAVRIDRPADRARSVAAECALGFDFVECEGRTPMQLRWQLRARDGRDLWCGAEPAAGRIIAARSSGGRFTPAIVERWMGCFDAEAGATYAVQVDAISGLDDLAPFNPRFVVLSSAHLDRRQHSLTAAIWMTSLLVGLAGVLVVSHRRS